MTKSKFFLSVAFLFYSVNSFAGITRTQYLVPDGSSTTSMAMAWRTSNKTTGTVHYGLNSTSDYSFTTTEVTDRHYAKITGLEAGKKYKYKVESDGDITKEYSFRVSPMPESNEEFLIGIMADLQPEVPADNGGQGKYPSQMTNGINLLNEKRPDILIGVGDIVLSHIGTKDHPTIIPARWDNMFNMCSDLFANTLHYWIVGNHDFAPADNDMLYYYYRQNVYNPHNSSSSLDEIAWQADYGNFRMISYKFREDLEKLESPPAEIDWVTVCNHFCAGDHIYVNDPNHYGMGFSPEWGKELMRHRVDFTMVGHTHSYSRSPVISYESPLYEIRHIVANGSAQYTKNTKGTISLNVPWLAPYIGLAIPCLLNPVAYSEYNTDKSKRGDGVAFIKVHGKKLHYMAYNTSGSVPVLMDEFFWDKSISLNPDITNLIIDGVKGFSAVLKWQTNIPTNALVEYKESSSLDWKRCYLEQRFEKDHVYPLYCLTPNTNYQARVNCMSDGITAQQTVSFRTGGAVVGEIAAKFDFATAMYGSDAGNWWVSPENQYGKNSCFGWINGSKGMVDGYFADSKGGKYMRGLFPMNPDVNWFKVSLPNGKYSVSFGGGGSWTKTNQVSITIENEEKSFSNLSQPGKYSLDDLSVTVEDGVMDVKINQIIQKDNELDAASRDEIQKLGFTKMKYETQKAGYKNWLLCWLEIKNQSSITAVSEPPFRGLKADKKEHLNTGNSR